MKVQNHVDFNKEAVKKMSKANFLKQHEHHAEDVNLSDVYDQIVGKEKTEEVKKEAVK
jgi:hypothetical protein